MGHSLYRIWNILRRISYKTYTIYQNSLSSIRLTLRMCIYYYHYYYHYYVYSVWNTPKGTVQTRLIKTLHERILPMYYIVHYDASLRGCLVCKQEQPDGGFVHQVRTSTTVSCKNCGIFCEFALRLYSLNLTDDQSTLVQVMAWCRWTTGHYLR